ncbi:aminotransferase class V-fold PLP-dependent enzyme [Mesorhizobium sp. BR1-1-16]|uniref:pyridoxal phosphate-dependent decarboxylase family protein n=1 Tax=Mesorhizobium sp. BR1-1-16 TaxID=2876653 RepID=UPI001CCB6B77|nr:aminotransferase class V-fold PLP-dependent enzyme [Mesorhizobium sp. BR1-1-16]MBZ9935555.1 aminotransferase class V-fold PLP-dependent enzyme [Mesorhizobium sp. BR1-1-16]
MTEEDLLAEADRRAASYLRDAARRRPFPDARALAGLALFDEPLPSKGRGGADTLALFDGAGSPATVASNGPRYFGFVLGASLPAASAIDRMVLAWDQCASSHDTSPVSAAVEKVAAHWILEILDLPRESGVGFGTSATTGTITCLSAARRTLLARAGWDFDRDGLAGSPGIRIALSATAHISVRKAVRLLGFGNARVIEIPTDDGGRVDPARLPALDDRTIVCLQAGEVNTGAFDPFEAVIPVAKAAGAWVHVDGAFGLWARASNRRALTAGIDAADSWTTDGHKWLNTPYDCAVAICRDRDAMAQAMNSDAAYFSAAADSQKNMTMEFSRRPRGVSIWAALRSLGRDGVAALIERHCDYAAYLGRRLLEEGFDVVNSVCINQVLVRCADDVETLAVREAVLDSGRTWFSPTSWQGRPAFRLSISSWRTEMADIEMLIEALIDARQSVMTAAKTMS